ncbi:mechanosensitive ion channel family protein [Pontivivens insulae]|uniref:Small-conductance mechanosensitive channel n=1 Tax=Pontivivens insulae TaxID=1639689 RepID=A0A2R8AF07_9RHOB|nr:mechanosensitive ion channel domain-containing protein [Pontivivens insulae]RED11899.1 small conductance mechanosensitive channel [Pontivivens insulae]SPF30655.1 Small-conductance mechanosensitive channel [Pontivivens insulae]
MAWWLDLIFDVLVASVIAVVAVVVAGIAQRQVRRIGRNSERFDETLFNFLGTVARYTILVFAAIFILARFGIQTASLIAVIGAAGLAIGLALQGTLSSLASGLMLLGFRPFKIGDFVEVGGRSGTVVEIGLFATELSTPDNVQVFVPNGDVWSGAILNYSHHETRRVDLLFGVSYGTDLAQAEAAIREVIADDMRVHDDRPIMVLVTGLADSAVEFTVRVWVARADYFEVKGDLQRRVKERFDSVGIDIPYPTQTVLKA